MRAPHVVLLVACAMSPSCDLVPRHPDTRSVVTRLPHAEGLRVGTRVVMAGVDVGQVVRIDTVPCAVELRLEIARPDAPLHEGLRAEVRPSGLIGADHIVLVPPALVTPPLARGAEIPGTQRASTAAERREAFRSLATLMGQDELAALIGTDSGARAASPRLDTLGCDASRR